MKFANSSQLLLKLSLLGSVLVLAGCPGGGGGGGKSFSFLDSSEGAEDVACLITNSAPEGEGTKVAALSNNATTFAVTPNVGSCKPTWSINGVTRNSTDNLLALTGADLVDGVNEVKVVVGNSKGSASRSWTVTKNAPPVCGSRTPAAVSFNQKAGQVQTLLLNATDSDGDPMTFAWKLNGQTAAGILDVMLSSPTASQASFASTNSQIGSNAVVAIVNDGYDSVECGWNITVVGNCSILSGSPSASTVRVNNAPGTQSTFGVTTESVGCPVTWTLNGAPLTGTDPSRLVASGDLLVGANVLQATITSNGNTTTKTWTVRRNALPFCSQSPAGTVTQNTGVGMGLSLTANTSDTDNDIVTVNWLINGVTAPTSVLSHVDNATSSEATFTPTSTYIGQSVVTAVLSDGSETSTCAWPVRTIPDCQVTSSFPSGPTKKISTNPVNNTAFGVVPNDAGCNVSWSLNGVAVGTGTVLNLASNNVNFVDGNNNTLVATLSNGINTPVTRTWAVDKNIAPLCASQVPLATGNSMTSAQTLGLSAVITNTDSDPLTVNWTLNGTTSALFGSKNATLTSISSIFAPAAGVIGNNLPLKAVVNDGYDSAECSWFVDITDPATVNISSCTPASTSVSILSQDPNSPGNYDSKAFVVSATGPGLTYQWKRDGTNISGTTSANFSTSSDPVGGWPSGTHSLAAVVTDAYGNSQSCTWSVKKNDKPVIDSWNVRKDGVQVVSNIAPGPSPLKLNYGTSLDFQIFAHDPNAEDAGTFTYRWKLDGALVNPGDSVLGYTVAGNKSYSTATLNPGGDGTLVGSHTITASLWDGSEETTKTWTVHINRFNEPCNTMANTSASNATCVIAGISNIGEGMSPDTEPQKILTRAAYMHFLPNGNAFFSEINTHTVWFWNRGNATTLFGMNVPANSLKVVAGGGYAGFYGDGFHATRSLLNNPTGLAYDGSNLYIGDVSNNRVRMVNASGIISTIVGSGSTDTATTPGTAARCDDPRFLYLLDANNLLVSCRGRNVVKKVDLSNSAYPVTNYLGVPAATAVVPVNNNDTAPSAVNIAGPWGITQDHLGNVFVAEDGGCRIRAINNTATSKTFLGVTIAAGMTKYILGTLANNCNGYPTPNVSTPRGLIFDPARKVLIMSATGSNREGLFVLNISDAYGPGATVSYGSGGGQVTSAVGAITRIAGNGANAGYLGEGNFAQLTRFNDPRDLSFDPIDGKLYVSDYGNVRMRRLNSDNRTELVMGNGTSRIGSAGNGSVDAAAEKFNQPRSVLYDKYNDALFIGDAANYRIRRIDKFGQSTLAVGTGASGSGAEEEELPTAVTIGGVRSMIFVGENAATNFAGHMVYADASNHRVRFWNRSTSSVTYFGTTIPAGTVKTVAGSGIAGNSTSGQATSSDLNGPSGLATDGSNLFIADLSNHCIKKVDSTGALSAVAGTCGTAGNVNGAVGTGRLNSPEGLAYSEFTLSSVTHKGLFIADRGNNRVKFLRLAGPPTIANTTVPSNEAHDVACGGAKHDDEVGSLTASCSGVYDVTMMSGQRVCFTNFNYHNVRCVSLSDGKIRTVMGPLQGETQGALNVAYYFPGTSFGSDDQNNVTAAVGIQTPGLVNPPATQKFGRMCQPLGLGGDGSNLLFTTEYSSGLIRKVVTP